MILTILQRTPVWIWGLLAGLIWLGWSQTRDRDLGLPRLLAMPLALLGLSLFGVFGAFGTQAVALLSWALAFAAALGLGRRRLLPRGAFWQAESRRVHVPGSWWPMVLIVGLFLLKYVAGVALAVQPRLAAEPVFAGLFSLAYGAFSGLFLARAWALAALANAGQGPAAAALSTRT